MIISTVTLVRLRMALSELICAIFPWTWVRIRVRVRVRGRVRVRARVRGP